MAFHHYLRATATEFLADRDYHTVEKCEEARRRFANILERAASEIACLQKALAKARKAARAEPKRKPVPVPTYHHWLGADG